MRYCTRFYKEVGGSKTYLFNHVIREIRHEGGWAVPVAIGIPVALGRDERESG